VDSEALLRAIAAVPERGPPAGVGDRVAHFVLQERLGRGGMGVVFRALDEKLGREVALKLLPAGFESSAERRERFAREARAAAAVSHPNIAAVHEIGEDAGRLYIAMELARGRSLRALLDEGRPRLVDAVRIARHIAAGLAVAHARGIVHRDLKPENVAVGQGDEVKILDFGLAKLESRAPSDTTSTVQSVTETGQVLGTPAYMSPEQAAGRAVDARTDLYSLGVVLYEMCTGHRPFAGSSGELVAAILRDDPEPPSRRNPEVSAELDALVLELLAKEPGARPESADRVRATLEAIEPSRLAGRPPAWRLLAIAAVIAAAGAAGVGWLRPWTPATHSAAASAPLASAAPTAVTSLPAPRTSSPEAAAAYAAAVQAIHDDLDTAAGRDLARAIQLDPDFAAAHMRLTIWAPSAGLSRTDEHDHFLEAWRRRAMLSERDRAVLGVFEPLRTSDTPDWEEAARRARALAEAYPFDAEAQGILQQILWYAGHYDEAKEAGDRALAIDPTYAWIVDTLGTMAFMRGDYQATLAYDERCVGITATAVGCIDTRARARVMLGQCAELEDEARRILAVDSKAAFAYHWLTGALAARGAPIESLREAYGSWTALTQEPEEARAIANEGDLSVALLTGDFAAAERVVRDTWDGRGGVAGSAAGLLMSMYLETGQDAKALAVAEDLARRAAGGTRGPAFEPAMPQALVLRHRAGRISDDELRSARDEVLRARTPLVPPHVRPILWYSVFAQPVATPDEARDALATKPDASPPPDPAADGALGRVLYLAGRSGDAATLLGAEARTCAVLGGLVSPVGTTIDAIRDRAFLGQALEAAGDTTGACSAYGFVLTHWGSARPRSRSAEVARARSRALGCR
jgi:serine/threonine-protein kinase